MVHLLPNRFFSVKTGNHFSSSAPITCGVPESSILGPILSTLYMPYTFLPLEPGDNNNNTFRSLLHCLQRVKHWMAKNCVQLNDSKTEVDSFDLYNSIWDIAKHLWSLTPNLHAHTRNIGIIFNPALKHDKQINTVVKGCQTQTFHPFNDFNSFSARLLQCSLFGY